MPPQRRPRQAHGPVAAAVPAPQNLRYGIPVDFIAPRTIAVPRHDQGEDDAAKTDGVGGYAHCDALHLLFVSRSS
jgi:hypothetical protein